MRRWKSLATFRRVDHDYPLALARVGMAAAFIGRMIAPLLVGPLRKYGPIHADDVAAAMLYAANHDVRPGPIESDEIAVLARQESAANKKAG
jgi:hypothetical protein